MPEARNCHSMPSRPAIGNDKCASFDKMRCLATSRVSTMCSPGLRRCRFRVVYHPPGGADVSRRTRVVSAQRPYPRRSRQFVPGRVPITASAIRARAASSSGLILSTNQACAMRSIPAPTSGAAVRRLARNATASVLPQWRTKFRWRYSRRRGAGRVGLDIVQL